MTKVIKEISKEQEVQIPVYIKKWVDLASKPINREEVKKIFKSIYKEDKIVVFGESFENMLQLIAVATEGKKMEYDSQLRSQLHSQLYSQLDSQLYSQLDSQLYSQLDSQLYSQLRSQLYSQLDSQLDSQLYSQLYSQLHSQLHSQLDSQLYSQLHSQLDSQLYSQLDSQLYSQDIKWNYYVSYYLYDWAGYYDYAESIGVEFDKSSLKEYFNILLNIPIVVFIGNVLFVCEKPLTSWNTQGILHDRKFPAIRWKDGTGFYYLNGVQFDKELFEKVTSGTMPVEDMLKIVDVDQRKQALRFGNVWDFVKLVNGKELDTHTKVGSDGRNIRYWLYQFPKGDIFDRDVTYTIYEDSMLGSASIHMQGVPNECKTVAEAFAWKFSDDLHTLTAEEWLSLQLDKDFA